MKECRLLAHNGSSPGTMARSAYRRITDRRAGEAAQRPTDGRAHPGVRLPESL